MRRLVRAALLAVAVFYGACVLALLASRLFAPPVTAVQLQRVAEAAWHRKSYRSVRRFVPLEQIGLDLRHAVIAAEDSRFYEHGGVDWDGLRQAIADNWERGRLWRGGSTMTQQLVKNLFLTTYMPLLRKPVEIPLALLAELILTKRRILELYLNVVEWGPGVFGAEAAARYHYGVAAARLTRNQAARLAACLPDPRHRSPREMDRYASVIERRMRTMGW